jgi:hypothetical protein
MHGLGQLGNLYAHSPSIHIWPALLWKWFMYRRRCVRVYFAMLESCSSCASDDLNDAGCGEDYGMSNLLLYSANIESRQLKKL